MSNPKDHHYVPRCFFKPWEDESRKVFVYERKNNLIIPPYKQSTKSICVHENLYSYTDKVEGKQRNVIEQKYFSSIDSDASVVLQKLQESSQVEKLSEQDRIHFSIFIISLRMRTPEGFLYNAQKSISLLRESLSRKDDPELEKFKTEQRLTDQAFLELVEKNHSGEIENFGRELIVKSIFSYKFAEPILKMKWGVVKTNSTNLSLLTSDRPLVFIGGGKVLDKTFVVSISPEDIFIASNDAAAVEKILALPTEKLIQHTNVSTIQQANSKAFAKDKRHSIRFFENRLGRHHDVLPWVGLLT